MVGVGGQGILTIGELIAQAAAEEELPANFYPTKGMAQRGGFVKAQLRIGLEFLGPSIPEGGADLVIAMERSESLKAIRYLKPGGEFLLWDFTWLPAAVVLKKATYPEKELVLKEISARGKLIYLDPASILAGENSSLPENVFILGVAVSCTRLREIISEQTMEKVISQRWEKYAQLNLTAFRAGLEYRPC